MTISKARKPRKKNIALETAISLRAADGTPFYAVPSEVANSLRRMMTGLMHHESLPPRISVVATLRKEGVTFTTLALAATLANDLTSSVCAVELNWHNPGMYNQLTSLNKKRGSKPSSRRAAAQAEVVTNESSPGLAAVLVESATLDDALIQTDRPNLALLPAGELSMLQRPSVARSEILQNCIEELGQRFDHLVLDIPALLSTSDAIALASLGSACCMVIQQGVTPVNDVKAGLDEVKHLPILGVVLNKLRIHTPKWILNFLPED